MKDILATIIHISDPHFGEKLRTRKNIFKKVASYTRLQSLMPHDYDTTWALSEIIRQILKDRKNSNVPAGVVLSGDLTCNGKRSEFHIGTTFLRGKHWTSANNSVGLELGREKSVIDIHTSPALFIVPGNHDIWKRKDPTALTLYQSYFSNSYPKTWKIKTYFNNIYLHGLNSTENTLTKHRLARGKISIDQLNEIEQRINSLKGKEKDSIHIVFLHHPIVGSDGAWKSNFELDDYNKVALRLLNIVDLVLSGHVHQHHFHLNRPDCPPHAIVGSALQMYSDQNFYLIDIKKRIIRIQNFKFNNKINKFVTRQSVRIPVLQNKLAKSIRTLVLSLSKITKKNIS